MEALLLDQILTYFREMKPFSEVKSLFEKQSSFGSKLELCWLDLPFQEKVYSTVMCDPLVERYPRSMDYSMKFLNLYIQLIEEHNIEVYDGLLRMYLKYLQKMQVDGSNSLLERYGYITYHINGKLHDAITVRTFQEFNLVGLTTWEAGLFLCEFVLSNKDWFSGKHCLELGAGVGLVSVVLSRIGVYSLISTDHTVPVLSNLLHNLQINDVLVNSATDFTVEESISVDRETSIYEELNRHRKSLVYVCELNWNDFKQEDLKGFSLVEKIVASDVLYDPSLNEALVKILKELLQMEGDIQRECFIVQTIRNISTLENFIQLAITEKIDVRQLFPIEQNLHHFFSDYSRENIVVYKLTLRK